MERAIVRSDLTKSEIQPQLLLDKYLEQLSIDIKWMLPVESLQEAFCPVTGEKETQDTFQKWECSTKLFKPLATFIFLLSKLCRCLDNFTKNRLPT